MTTDASKPALDMMERLMEGPQKCKPAEGQTPRTDEMAAKCVGVGSPMSYVRAIDLCRQFERELAALQQRLQATEEWERRLALALHVPGCSPEEMLNVVDSLVDLQQRVRDRDAELHEATTALSLIPADWENRFDTVTAERDMLQERVRELESAFADRVRVITMQLDDKDKLLNERQYYSGLYQSEFNRAERAEAECEKLIHDIERATQQNSELLAENITQDNTILRLQNECLRLEAENEKLQSGRMEG